MTLRDPNQKGLQFLEIHFSFSPLAILPDREFLWGWLPPFPPPPASSLSSLPSPPVSPLSAFPVLLVSPAILSSSFRFCLPDFCVKNPSSPLRFSKPHQSSVPGLLASQFPINPWPKVLGSSLIHLSPRALLPGELPDQTPPLTLPRPCSPLIEMLMRLLWLPSLTDRRAGGLQGQALHLSGERVERLGCQIQLERNQSLPSHTWELGSGGSSGLLAALPFLRQRRR